MTSIRGQGKRDFASESSNEQVNGRAIVIQRAGELSEFVQVLEALAVDVEIHDGARMPSPDEVAGAAVIVVSGQRLLEGGTPNLSLWPRTLAVVDKASKTMLAHLNRVGAAMVIRRPIHPRTLRLVLLHEIYQGPERRRRKRTLIGHPIRVGAGLFKQRATLLELSDTGARLELPKAPKVGSKLHLLIGKDLTQGKPLKLQAKVVRGIGAPGENGRQDAVIGVAIVDPRKHHKDVSALLDRFASGPASWNGKVEAATSPTASAVAAPDPKPGIEEIDPEASARRLPPPRATDPTPSPAPAAEPAAPVESVAKDDDVPHPVPSEEDAGTSATASPTSRDADDAASVSFQDDTTETIPADAIDPETSADEIEADVEADEIEFDAEALLEEVFPPDLAAAEDESDDEASPEADEADEADDRRRDPRIPYDRRVVALGHEAARVLVGRDLSHGGMRIAATDAVDVGDTLRVALHCGTELEPLVVLATALRDDGDAGIVLEFQDLSDGQRDHMEKIIASSSPVQIGPNEDLNEKTGSVVMGERSRRSRRPVRRRRIRPRPTATKTSTPTSTIYSTQASP